MRDESLMAMKVIKWLRAKADEINQDIQDQYDYDSAWRDAVNEVLTVLRGNNKEIQEG